MKNALTEINFATYLPEVSGVSTNLVVQGLLAGDFPKEKVDLVIRYIIHTGYRFSTKELPWLTQPIENRYRKCGMYKNMTFAHVFAWRGYLFPLTELLALDNPKNDYDETVAHFMVRAGHFFTVDELIQMRNPSTFDGIGRRDAYEFPGDTVAHLMAEAGYKFSPVDIFALGNPKNFIDKGLNEVWEYYKEKREQKQSAGIQGKRTRKFLFRDGEPFFEIDGYDGRQIAQAVELWIGSFNSVSIDYDIDQSFFLTIQASPSGWSIQLQDGQNSDPFNFLYRKILVLELVKKLNQAASECRPDDFSNDVEMLNEIFDFHEIFYQHYFVDVVVKDSK